MHPHHREDEYSIDTDGRVGFVLGDDVFEAGPGDLVGKPRDQWHSGSLSAWSSSSTWLRHPK